MKIKNPSKDTDLDVLMVSSVLNEGKHVKLVYPRGGVVPSMTLDSFPLIKPGEEKVFVILKFKTDSGGIYPAILKI